MMRHWPILLLCAAAPWTGCEGARDPTSSQDAALPFEEDSLPAFEQHPPLQTTDCVVTPDKTDYYGLYKRYRQEPYGLQLIWSELTSGSYTRQGKAGQERLFVDQCAGIVIWSRKTVSGVQRVRWRIAFRR